MVSFSKRRRRNLTFAVIVFLSITVISSILLRFWRPDYYFAIGTVVGLTGLVGTGFAFFRRRNATLATIAVGLLLCASIYFLRDSALYQNAVAALVGKPPNAPVDEEELSLDTEDVGDFQLTVRVFDAESSPIRNAQVLVFHEGPPTTQYTDSQGVVIFETDETEINADLVVNHPEHEIREETIRITSSDTLEIKLTRKDESEGTVIVYVVDNQTDNPVSGATVTIIAEGSVFQDVTDDVGLSRFPLDFPTGQLDVEMNITTTEYATANRSLTIRPNDVQTVRLNPADEAIVSVEKISAAETSTLSDDAVTEAIPPTFSTAIEPTAEEEPNDAVENAQILAEVGMENPVQATIRAAANDGDPGDVDWYGFTAVAGQTYVIELYSVANNIDLVSRRYNCGGSTQTLTGLRTIVYDPAGNEVARVCTPNGSGNTHTLLSFVSGVSGEHTIQVAAHAPQVSGDYHLRILPKFDDEAAKWDRATFEPNNSLYNAFSITPAHENALTSVIEPRQASYSTRNGDIDAYRFSVIAGQSYVIELFNVANNLTLRSSRYNCDGSTKTHSGLQLIVYDPSYNEVARQCSPNGVGNVHSIVQFTAGASGEHFVRVTPHEGTVSGNYSIRILPKHDETGASWDVETFEPNNRAMNGYELVVDAEPLRSRIEGASNVYSTSRSDQDWYRFNVVSGNSYVVEILDVDGGIVNSEARYNCEGSTRTHSGFWLGVFDDTVTEISRQCIPNGTGNVHTAIEFTASRNGTFYALLYPHSGDAAGEYSVRIRQK